MNTAEFIDQLASTSLPGVFNPYRDRCDDHDHAHSQEIRRSNLQVYLTTVITSGVDSVWFGRDYGYRGGRRTGIALTDELHLSALENHFGMSGIGKATVGDAVKERTATYVWDIIHEIRARVFLWNVFPFHPFEPGNPMSNRRHTASEFRQSANLLIALLELLQPKRIVALGGDAFRALQSMGIDVVKVRHPSYGGHIEFANSIRNLYRASPPK